MKKKIVKKKYKKVLSIDVLMPDGSTITVDGGGTKIRYPIHNIRKDRIFQSYWTYIDYDIIPHPSGTYHAKLINPPPFSDSSPGYLAKLKEVYLFWIKGEYKTTGEKQDALCRLCELRDILYSDILIYRESLT